MSSIGLGILLFEGIGDTLRVSLTADPVEEVRVAWEILKSLQIRQRGITITSCPTCGRTHRITSYNVCYTKLLRASSGGGKNHPFRWKRRGS